MSCENKLTNLVFKNKENSARTTKTPYHEMHECYAMQIFKKKKKMITKSREMKYKDYARKLQLD